jgi:hypothetical protein
MKRDIDTSSESWRHECEVRHVAAMRSQDRQRTHEYLELVAKRRGEEAANRLKEDAAQLWKAAGAQQSDN